MPNVILDDVLSDSGLPGAVRKAIRAKADELKASKGLDDKAAAREAIEEFHGITREDLQTTLDALKGGEDNNEKDDQKEGRRQKVLTPGHPSGHPNFHRGKDRGPIEGRKSEFKI